jgi:uncharacterized membrane protein YgaE (UPF0421/DUF939 family)
MAREPPAARSLASVGVVIRARASELRGRLAAIALASATAIAAYVIARELTGEARPFFAPVAAILTLSLTAGQQMRRAIEVSLGVALGIGVAELLTHAIGTGLWQLCVIVFLTMCAAVLVRSSPLIVNQAAISAILIVTVRPARGAFFAARFVDALIGGAVALVAWTLVPSDPLRLVTRELTPLLKELAQVLTSTAHALDHDDHEQASAALQRVRALDTTRFTSVLAAAAETPPTTAGRRRAREQLAVITHASKHIEHLVRNAGVLVRASLRPIELHEHVPRALVDAIRKLAVAIGELDSFLSGADPAAPAARSTADAASSATAALSQTRELSPSILVGQVRLMAVDLLRALGEHRQAALATVRSGDR